LAFLGCSTIRGAAAFPEVGRERIESAPLGATSCGFDSRLGHHAKRRKRPFQIREWPLLRLVQSQVVAAKTAPAGPCISCARCAVCDG
jgi:hypothetical protein